MMQKAVAGLRFRQWDTQRVQMNPVLLFHARNEKAQSLGEERPKTLFVAGLLYVYQR